MCYESKAKFCSVGGIAIYVEVAVASFLSATVLPGASEASVLHSLMEGNHPLLTIAIASIFNTLGSMTTYAIGAGGRFILLHLLLKKDTEKASRWQHFASRWGYWAGLLVWTPVVGDVIAIAMGMVRTPILSTFVTILTGKTLRYVLLWLGYVGVVRLTGTYLPFTVFW